MADVKRLHIIACNGTFPHSHRIGVEGETGAQPWIPEERHVRARVSWQARAARKDALLQRCKAAMARREPDGISDADWDQLLQDIGKEIN